MSAAPSQSPSPQRKTQQQQQQQQSKIGGIGVLSSPKFSFRAALVQHKASKLASKGVATSSGNDANSASPLDSTTRSIRPMNTSSIPSLKGRGRFNSTSTDSAFTSTLPRRRDVGFSPETSRASSSLGKRPMEETTTAMQPAAADGSILSDFGPIMRKSSALVSSSGSINQPAASSSTRSRTATSKLPGPPSARTQWNVGAGSLKSMPSPSSASKAPRKIARSDSVAEVHAATAPTTPNCSATSPASAHSGSKAGSVRNRTVSASARPSMAGQPQRAKIGTLPRLKPKTAPVKTLLDEKPIQQLKTGLLSGLDDGNNEDGESDDDEHDDDEDVDQDDLEGPDVSRIRTRRIPSQRNGDTTVIQNTDSTPTPILPPPSNVSTGSRIPSLGSSNAAKSAARLPRRSSSNSLNPSLTAHVNEKENIAHKPASSQLNPAPKRHSVGAAFGAPARMRSSLPLVVSQTAPQSRASSTAQAQYGAEHHIETSSGDTFQPVQSIPASPTKTSSLSALRTRGLQTGSTEEANPRTSKHSATLPRSSKQDLGIRASIIQANPVHPSILALQAAKATQHQPISTPEALIKAKKRLSGALLSSSSSSSNLSSVGSTASPSERISSLPRSSSISKFGSQKKLPGTARVGTRPTDGAEPAAGAIMTPSASVPFMPRSGSRSPIKSSLLLFPTVAKDNAAGQEQIKDETASPESKVAVAPSSTLGQRSAVLTTSEIDANLLASLKVVAQKANIKVGDLLDDERRQQQQTQQGAVDAISASSHQDKATYPLRSQRDASEELEAWAGDVSVDLMALDLAAGSPESDLSMLRSPLLRETAYLDTPPSVLAAGASMVSKPEAPTELGNNQAEGQVKDDEEGDVTQVDDDATDTSCASPSLRAAAALRLPRRLNVAVKDNNDETVETPVRRQAYRNVPSIPSTPFPTSASTNAISPSKSARAYPPSAAMSAKTRSKLKKALRESLGLEAHFASIKLGPQRDERAAGSAVATEKVDAEQDGQELLAGSNAKRDGDVRKSISAMLLTDDDRYLDELVSAVARIGLEDLAPEQQRSPQGDDADFAAPTEPTSSTQSEEALTPPLRASTTDSAAALQTQLSAALSELASLRTQLQLSQTQSSDLKAQLAVQAASAARTTRTQAILENDLAALKCEMAGAEWEKAKTNWSQARVEALAELEDAKVQRDVMLVLRAQLGVWEGLVGRC